MKTIYLFFLILIISINNYTIVAQITEKAVEGETYLIDSSEKKVVNAKNTIGHKDIRKKCEFLGVKEPYSINEIFEMVFSMEKIAFLAEEKKAIVLTLFCDSTGKIISVEFRMRETRLSYSDKDSKTVTLKELHQLEQLLKKYQFVFTTYCPDVPYYTINRGCVFSKLKE